MVEFLLQYHAYTTPVTEGKDFNYPDEKYMGYRLRGQGDKILANCVLVYKNNEANIQSSPA